MSKMPDNIRFLRSALQTEGFSITNAKALA